MSEYKEGLIQQQDCHSQNRSGALGLRFQIAACLIIKTDVLKLQFYSML